MHMTYQGGVVKSIYDGFNKLTRKKNYSLWKTTRSNEDYTACTDSQPENNIVPLINNLFIRLLKFTVKLSSFFPQTGSQQPSNVEGLSGEKNIGDWHILN